MRLLTGLFESAADPSIRPGPRRCHRGPTVGCVAIVAEGKAMLRKRWGDLQTPPPGLARAVLARWKRERGYALEQLIVDLARMEGIEAKYGYPLAGEQVDGYFVLDHRHFLLE